MYEIHALFKFQHLKEQEKWEQTRLISFLNAKCAGVKNLNKLTDLIEFPWEKKTKKNNQIMSDSDMKRLQEKATWMINNNILE